MNRTLTREELRALTRKLFEPRYGPLSDTELDLMHRRVFHFVALLMEWRGDGISLDEMMREEADEEGTFSEASGA